MSLIPTADLLDVAAQLGLNLLFAVALVGLIYQRFHRNREYMLTYLLFNLVTFVLCSMLRRVQMELGFALGLFAVFGVLRYRTASIRIIDLTYLFVAIGLAMLNGIAGGRVGWGELVFVNLTIVAMTAGLELYAHRTGEHSVPLLYDNLPLLGAAHREALLSDLRERTGLHVVRVSIQRIDLLRDAAELRAFYAPLGGPELRGVPSDRNQSEPITATRPAVERESKPARISAPPPG